MNFKYPKVALASAQPEEPSEVRWSSHPIQRYTIGEYSFENGLLVLRGAPAIQAFQAVYDSLPIVEQNRLKRLDLAAAEAMVAKMLGIRGGATKQIDSATGERAPSNQVGSGTLESRSGGSAA